MARQRARLYRARITGAGHCALLAAVVASSLRWHHCFDDWRYPSKAPGATGGHDRHRSVQCCRTERVVTPILRRRSEVPSGGRSQHQEPRRVGTTVDTRLGRSTVYRAAGLVLLGPSGCGKTTRFLSGRIPTRSLGRFDDRHHDAKAPSWRTTGNKVGTCSRRPICAQPTAVERWCRYARPGCHAGRRVLARVNLGGTNESSTR